MLVEMDGFGVNEGIIVMAATNRVDILDPAIMRPGRFDRKVYVGRPDIGGREEILAVHAKNKPLGDDVDLKQIAQTTAGFTGADLENLLNEAAIIAAKENRAYITQNDMVANGSIQNTMIPMIRLGEMFLIAAESQSDDLAKGVQYVNALRRNRGVANLQTLTPDLLKYEYIRELYGEGQLFYLYKRLNSDIITSSNANKNPKASDLIFVVPLPDSETEN